MDDDALLKYRHIHAGNDTTVPTQGNGVYIVNEGNFMYNNASLSYYNIEKQNVYNDVFYVTNKLPLGDVAHSMAFHDSTGYVVVNNSGKIYCFDMQSFKYTGKITGLVSPRYIHFIDHNKAYISDLYARSIAVANTRSLTITGYIDVNNRQPHYNTHPTEQMVSYDRFVFTNCWSNDNKILVIDTKTDKLVDSIEVPLQPTALLLDRFNKLWVLCDGGYAGHSMGNELPALVKIDTETRLIERVFRFASYNPTYDLCTNGTRDTLYYISGAVWQMPVNSKHLPEKPFIEQHQNLFYTLGVDPVNTDIYVADAIDYVQAGVVYRFRRDAVPLDTFRVGINPGWFCFKPVIP